MSEPLEILKQIHNITEDLKSVDVCTFDMRGISPEYDFCHICGATSGTHIRGICENLSVRLKKCGITPLGIEGEREGVWALMDYNQVVVHIVLIEERERLNLEELFESLGGKKIGVGD